MVLDFPVLADYSILYIDGVTIFATHGHHFNLKNMPPHKENDILLHGHTHVPACICENGMWYINPGSVSIPKEDSPHSYIIFENDYYNITMCCYCSIWLINCSCL